jgi:hypothetical protein
MSFGQHAICLKAQDDDDDIEITNCYHIIKALYPHHRYIKAFKIKLLELMGDTP